MYAERGAPHRLPHFHAYHADDMATFTIHPPALLEGALPRRQMRLVLAWAELHIVELVENWQCIQDGLRPSIIPGL